MPSLIGKVLINKVLPSKREILQSFGKLVKETIKSPKKAFKDGLARDKKAVELYKQLTGKSRMQATDTVARKVAKGVYKGGGKDLAVNVGGTLGSAAGSMSAGVAGKYGGDYIGAVLSRRALDDTEAVVKAYTQVKKKALKQSWYRQGKLVQRRASKIAKKKRKTSIPEYKKDHIGYVVGNSSNEALQKVGSHVPLQGGMIAMTTVDPIYRGMKVSKRLFRQNPDQDIVRKGAVVTGRRLRKALSPNQKIKKGNAREKIMYDSVNNELKSLPVVPMGISFKRKTNLKQF